MTLNLLKLESYYVLFMNEEIILSGTIDDITQAFDELHVSALDSMILFAAA